MSHNETSVTDSELIWNEIKDKKIDMFALPDQKVNQFCKPILLINPSKLYLEVSPSSVLPALESTLSPNFSVELVNKYVVVSRVKAN